MHRNSPPGHPTTQQVYGAGDSALLKSFKWFQRAGWIVACLVIGMTSGSMAGQTSTAAPAAAPPINIRTVPEGGATREEAAAQDELFKITKNVNQVMVPVTVKDE